MHLSFKVVLAVVATLTTSMAVSVEIQAQIAALAMSACYEMTHIMMRYRWLMGPHVDRNILNVYLETELFMSHRFVLIHRATLTPLGNKQGSQKNEKKRKQLAAWEVAKEIMFLWVRILATLV
ncbi:uncharacterized protein EDB93DRAFT_1102016 [Suillus bovinus]|uniref:uncharacterized protein n=1 Tax=Suillus bovinus TaxID=48563 RepID=UPI001B85EDC6|nr:uncharacterized protein EDB93DRAFT_1102016 [Suillus bovinus]KAG2155025.1 hypothetical protein EDB93DRAFT_1102016 [Suillus bovinus]